MENYEKFAIIICLIQRTILKSQLIFFFLMTRLVFIILHLQFSMWHSVPCSWRLQAPGSPEWKWMGGENKWMNHWIKYLWAVVISHFSALGGMKTLLTISCNRQRLQVYFLITDCSFVKPLIQWVLVCVVCINVPKMGGWGTLTPKVKYCFIWLESEMLYYPG